MALNEYEVHILFHSLEIKNGGIVTSHLSGVTASDALAALDSLYPVVKQDRSFYIYPNENYSFQNYYYTSADYTHWPEDDKTKLTHIPTIDSAEGSYLTPISTYTAGTAKLGTAMHICPIKYSGAGQATKLVDSPIFGTWVGGRVTSSGHEGKQINNPVVSTAYNYCYLNNQILGVTLANRKNTAIDNLDYYPVIRTVYGDCIKSSSSWAITETKANNIYPLTSRTIGSSSTRYSGAIARTIGCTDSLEDEDSGNNDHATVGSPLSRYNRMPGYINVTIDTEQWQGLQVTKLVEKSDYAREITVKNPNNVSVYVYYAPKKLINPAIGNGQVTDPNADCYFKGGGWVAPGATFTKTIEDRPNYDDNDIGLFFLVSYVNASGSEVKTKVFGVNCIEDAYGTPPPSGKWGQVSEEFSA